jgi:hypothetical protein
VLGIVGAGGIGFALNEAILGLEWARVSLILARDRKVSPTERPRPWREAQVACWRVVVSWSGRSPGPPSIGAHFLSAA